MVEAQVWDQRGSEHPSPLKGGLALCASLRTGYLRFKVALNLTKLKKNNQTNKPKKKK